MAATTGTFVEIRREGDSAGLFRTMKIFLNGELLARLRPGQAVSVPIQAGNHVVTAQMDWYHSRPMAICVTEGEKRIVHVRLAFASISKLFSGHDAIDIEQR